MIQILIHEKNLNKTIPSIAEYISNRKILK